MQLLSKSKTLVKAFMNGVPFLCSILQNYLGAKEVWNFRKMQKHCFHQILKKNGINLLLDVGAHTGETGLIFKGQYSFKGKILSFEPIYEKYLALEKRSSKDPLWKSFHLALGNKNETKQLNIFNNAYNSSFLHANDLLKKEGNLEKMREELVEIKRLDCLYPSLCSPFDSVLLKIDTQGFEREVLEGSGLFLSHIRLVKLEVSLISLYEGETPIGEMISLMNGKGFIPVLIEPGHISDTYYQLQANILFLNQNPGWPEL